MKRTVERFRRKWKDAARVVLIGGLFFACLSPAYAEPAMEEPVLQSESAILVEAETGTVLFGKNERQRMYPASITKLVTAIVAIEEAEPDEVVTVSKTARYEDGTRIYLAEGERKPMGDLLYGLMLNSGNDAATAIAEHISGSKENFAAVMNEFVRTKTGATDTHFANPSGLPDEQHYTTAADMAAIARYAMNNSVFRGIVSTKTMPWTGEEWVSELVNHNKLLWTYEGATGIKNGFTQAAGFTLVGAAQRNGMELIGVILKAPNPETQYGEMERLLDFGFAHFQKAELFRAGEAYTDGKRRFAASESIRTVIPVREQPVIRVDDRGIVTVITSMGLVTAGELMESAPPVGITEQPDDDDAVNAGLAAPPQRAAAPPRAAWLLLSLSLLILALAGVRSVRKRQRHSRGLDD